MYICGSPAAPKALPPELTGLPGATGGFPQQGAGTSACQGDLFEAMCRGRKSPKSWVSWPAAPPLRGPCLGVTQRGVLDWTCQELMC